VAQVRAVLATASIASEFGAGIGLLAGFIAVLGFVAQARPTFTGAPEHEVRQAVVMGGLCGLLAGILVIVLSAAVG
jgi:hypothetical protein